MYGYYGEKLRFNRFLRMMRIFLNILRVYQLERQLKTPDKFLHPCFETINWYAAVYLLDKIKGKERISICSFVF